MKVKQLGLSLVELMVSLAVGSLLLAGVINIFVTQKAHYRMQEGMGRVQENGRFIKFIMEQDLRMAGLLGCNSPEAVLPNNLISGPQPQQLYTNTNVISGYHGRNNQWFPSVPAWITANLPAGTALVPNTDVITIRRMESDVVNLASNMSNSSDPIALPNSINFQINDTVFITDCESTDIFQATTGTSATSVRHAATSNSSASLTKAYQTDAYVGRLQVYTYYIRTSGRNNANGNDIPVLARQDINGNEMVIADGVENMQIEFGLDTDSDAAADTFDNAENISTNNQWAQVVSMRVSHLVTSIDETMPIARNYTFQGNSVNNNDRLFRRQWDSFITFRNRAI